MPICRKCQKIFPNRIIIDGVPHLLCSRKYCLECSPWGKHNTRQIEPPDDKSKSKSCSICRRLLPPAEFKWKDGHRLAYCLDCRRSKSQLFVASRQQLKRKSVDFMGGSCKVCGYSKSISAMVFHHLDPSKKEFTLGSNCRSWDKTVLELRKCVLLCNRCHSEVHDGLIDLNQVA